MGGAIGRKGGGNCCPPMGGPDVGNCDRPVGGAIGRKGGGNCCPPMGGPEVRGPPMDCDELFIVPDPCWVLKVPIG